MTNHTLLRLSTSLALALSGALVAAQTQLPSSPPRTFGASVTPAYEGWFDNADGTHSFLIGYFNRNTASEIDVPLGPSNHFEPGTADMGQPTHFLTGRRYGMFLYTVPKEFTRTQKLTWVITVNGVTSSVPFHMSADYNITPFKSSEQGPTGAYNLPPVLRFQENGPSFSGPVAALAKAVSRTALAGMPMTLDMLVDDDARYSSGANTPMRGSRAPVDLLVTKYRGAGEVKIAETRAKLTPIKGGQPDEPYSAKGATTVTFNQAGDYMLHVTANDYSGNGGGGAGCCWTTALVKVAVKPAVPLSTTGQ